MNSDLKNIIKNIDVELFSLCLTCGNVDKDDSEENNDRLAHHLGNDCALKYQNIIDPSLTNSISFIKKKYRARFRPAGLIPDSDESDGSVVQMKVVILPRSRWRFIAQNNVLSQILLRPKF